MPDAFATNTQPGLDSPAAHIAQVSPNDAADLPFSSRALLIGVSGALKVTTVSGETVTLTAAVIVAGQPLPVRIARVWATGTTATDIWALW